MDDCSKSDSLDRYFCGVPEIDGDSPGALILYNSSQLAQGLLLTEEDVRR